MIWTEDMSILHLWQQEMLKMIRENPENHHLKCDYKTKIHLFRYKRLLNEPQREFTVAVDTNSVIHWIATYRFRTLQELWVNRHGPDFYFISLGVINRTQGLWSELVSHTLNRMKQRANIITLTIEPLEKDYNERLRKFLQRKCCENGLEMRESVF